MFKRILVPVDGAELTSQAMTSAIDVARQLGAGIVALVVEPSIPTIASARGVNGSLRDADLHFRETRHHAESVLTAFASHALAAGVAFEGRHASSTKVEAAIAAAAERLDCDLIVMVTHGRGPFGSLLFKSRTKGVLAASRRPLLVFHAEAVTASEGTAAAVRPNA